jgi:hypothetical protein
MNKASATVAIVCCVMLAGCVLSGKAAKPAAVTPVAPKPVASAPPPAPPPAPLSTPQTQVELPTPQPIDPAALAAEPPLSNENRPDQTPRSQQGRGRPAVSAPARPEIATPSQPATATPPATLPPGAAPIETAPPPISEIVPAAELKRLQDQARARRAEVQQILDQLLRRQQLTNAQRETMTQIRNFVDRSVEAENKGDMRQADALADRAQILAKDLINAK